MWEKKSYKKYKIDKLPDLNKVFCDTYVNKIFFSLNLSYAKNKNIYYNHHFLIAIV